MTETTRRVRAAWRVAVHAARGRTLALALLAAAQGLMPVISAWLLGRLVQLLILKDTPTVIFSTAGGIVAASTVSLLIPQWSRSIQAQLQRQVDRHVLVRVGERVGSVPYLTELEDPDFHDTVRLAQQAGTMGATSLTGAVSVLAQSAVTIVGFCVALFIISPVLGALALATGVPLLIGETRLIRSRVAATHAASPWHRRVFGFTMLNTDLRAAQEIRAFDLSHFVSSRLAYSMDGLHRVERTQDAREQRVRVLSAVAAAIISAGAIGYLIAGAVQGTFAVGDVAVVVAAIGGIAINIGSAVRQAADAGSALALFERYDQLDTKAMSGTDAHPVNAAPRLERSLGLREVWFRYDDNQDWVLRGITLDLPVGQATAIVGINGAGKSTIVKLLSGLYAPTKGALLWDGVDTNRYEIRSLRAWETVVYDNFMEYDLTAGENIAVGSPAYMGDHDLIRRAARAADVDHIIEMLPQGYDTLLSRIFFEEERRDPGAQLSRGQWQRIGIARALMRTQSRVVLLDEPGTGLDAATETDLLRSVMSLRSQAAVVLASHRLNCVRLADRIVVIDGGSIVETGSHESLMAARGRYFNLFHQQARGFLSDR